MEFLLNNFRNYRTRGLVAYKAGDYEDARYNLLKAAEYLFKIAKLSEEPLRSSRIVNAQKLLDLAKSVGSARAIQSGGGTDDEDPSKASRWIVSKKPDVSFNDVAGLDDVKQEIQKLIIYPFRHPEATRKFKKKAGGGVLLYGPPGTGKTMIAKAIANEIDAIFFSVRCSDIMSKWFGEAEKNLKQLFDEARSHARAVIFLDEVEAIVSKRGRGSTVMDRVIPEFLSQVDGLDTKESCLLLLGATNRPWDMDEAALRTGRFGRRIYVGLPDYESRREILSKRLADIPGAETVDLDEFAKKLEGYSGADIAGPRGVVDTATDFPYEREIQTGGKAALTKDDIIKAVETVKPTVSDKHLQRYSQFQGEM